MAKRSPAPRKQAAGKPAPGRQRRPVERATAAPDPQPEAQAAELHQLRVALDAMYSRQALLEAVIDSLPMWISVKDHKGRYLLVNSALAAGHGQTKADFLGRPTTETKELVPGGLQAMAEADARVLESGETYERSRYAARTPDGQERQRRLIKMPLRDEDGDVLGVVGWSEDITDSALAEDALAARQALLRALFDVVPHPISYVDREGRLMMVNPAWCEFVGVQAEEVIGLTVLEVEALPEQQRRSMHEDTRRALRTGRLAPTRELSLPDAGGTPRQVLISKATVRGTEGTIEGLVTVAVEVTELRTAEAAARIARERLLDAMEAMPAGLQLYDKDDRLEFANAQMKVFFPRVRELMRRGGVTFEQLVRDSLSDLAMPEAARERHVQRRLAEYRDPPASVEFLMQDGRHIMGYDRKTADGGTISVRFDITDQKRIQADLEQYEQENRAELALAAELQRAILRPVDAPDFLEAAWEYRPSGQVSGDLHHSWRDGSGGYHFFLGDATGHGVAAAFMTMLTEAGLRSLEAIQDPADALATLNDQLGSYEMDGRFVSGVFLSLSPAGELKVANAGHPPVIVLSPDQQPQRLLESNGFPLGWFPEGGYETERVTLRRGCTVIAYTDAMTESANAQDEEFGQERLVKLAQAQRRRRPKAQVAALLAGLEAHLGSQPVTDDLSLFAFRYLG